MDRPSFSVDDIFTRLAERIDAYEHREKQIELAHAIERAFDFGAHGIFEAGTGTGKSLSALIPSVLSGKRVVVSTNTISLQEQYLFKDIATLKSVVPFEFEAAIMKGRGNYLGMRRWDEFLIEQAPDDRLLDWVLETETGDVSELDFVPSYDVWMEINSDSDDCLRAKCPRFNECYYFESKRQAERANILIVNHALLLADAASHGNILPEYDYLIVDEAHHLPDVATDALTWSVSNRGIRILATRALKRLQAPPGLVQNFELEAQELFYRLSQQYTYSRTRVREPVPGAADLAKELTVLKEWLEAQDFDQLLDVDMAKEKAKLKARGLISTINGYLGCLRLMAEPDHDHVLWVERHDSAGSKISLVAAPLDVSEQIRHLLLLKKGLHSSVWMSATLATGGEDPFLYFKRAIGATDGEAGHVVQLKVDSPFDYHSQSVLYLPKNLPEPNSPAFMEAAAQEIERILSITQGRAFLLFTSKSALMRAYDVLRWRLPYEMKRQGEMPRQRLIDWFLSAECPVLFGTSSFWEGVSVDGEQLSCVIIDRIPFQVPDDPVYEARCEAMKENPEASWFNDLALPHATMRLKQGVGRLIRTKQDRGIVALLDSRLISKQYGSRILQCLPPMPIRRSISGIGSLDELFEEPVFD